jgi:3-deoxy-7-phosphoheptulonate synthase
MEEGLLQARKLLLDITEKGVACGTELLGPLTPQYIDDLISWAAIGARTTESQPHREMVSGLSMPVGFKNSTYGDIDVAINAIKSAACPHTFLGQDHYGKICTVDTSGNGYTHVILRGGNGVPNYDAERVNATIEDLRKANLAENLVIDCSHGNSEKKYEKQPEVFNTVIDQIANGNTAIKGIMIESYLYEGNQKLSHDLDLMYGVSITDGCISWDMTESLIRNAYQRVKKGSKSKISETERVCS